MKVVLRLLLVGAASLWANAAKADCTAGQQTACACPGGKSGVQVCADDGKRFGACACEALAEKWTPTLRLDAPGAVAGASAEWRF